MGHRKSKNQKSPELTRKTIDEIMTNTKFKEDEIKRHYKGFIKDCPDGFLTRRRLESTYKMIAPNGDPKQFCRVVFKAFDSNKDGLINFEEYMLVMALVYSVKSLYDIDGNGFLSLKELEQSLHAIYKLKQDVGGINMEKANIRQVSERIMQHCDTSRDNQISMEEFVQACKDDAIILTRHTQYF